MIPLSGLWRIFFVCIRAAAFISFGVWAKLRATSPLFACVRVGAPTLHSALRFLKPGEMSALASDAGGESSQRGPCSKLWGSRNTWWLMVFWQIRRAKKCQDAKLMGAEFPKGCCESEGGDRGMIAKQRAPFQLDQESSTTPCFPQWVIHCLVSSHFAPNDSQLNTKQLGSW